MRLSNGSCCARAPARPRRTRLCLSRAPARPHRRTEFDFDNNGIVDPNEFVNGLKRMALKAPLDATFFASVPSSHRECLLWLNASTNNTILQVCKEIYSSLGVCLTSD